MPDDTTNALDARLQTPPAQETSMQEQAATPLHLEIVDKMPSPKQPKFLKLSPALEEAILLHDTRGKSWVRVPLQLLDDPQFEALPDATKFHLIGLMMFIRRSGFNYLPNNEEFLRRKLGANTRIDLEKLRFFGFLIGAKRLKTKEVVATVTGALIRQDLRGEDLNTHTADEMRDQERGNPAAVGAGKSKFSYEQCFAFAEWQKKSGQLISGRLIENVGGLARMYEKEGSADLQISLWLNPESAPPPPPKPKPDCTLCFGSGMMNPDGRGARKCDCLKAQKEAKP